VVRHLCALSSAASFSICRLVAFIPVLRSPMRKALLAGTAALAVGAVGAPGAAVVQAEAVASAPPSALGASAASAPAAAAQALTLQAMEQALFERTNADRAARRLAPLAFDTELLEVARVRAGAQVALPRLSHNDDSGQLAIGRLLAAGAVSYGLAGENLARLPGFSAAGAAGEYGATAHGVWSAPGASGSTGVVASVAARAEAALMDSPLHRKNILEARFTSVAIGAVADQNGRVIFAQVFRGA
jgi:uncharacterized protein YkwD